MPNATGLCDSACAAQRPVLDRISMVSAVTNPGSRLIPGSRLPSGHAGRGKDHIAGDLFVAGKIRSKSVIQQPLARRRFIRSLRETSGGKICLPCIQRGAANTPSGAPQSHVHINPCALQPRRNDDTSDIAVRDQPDRGTVARISANSVLGRGRSNTQDVISRIETAFSFRQRFDTLRRAHIPKVNYIPARNRSMASLLILATSVACSIDHGGPMAITAKAFACPWRSALASKRIKRDIDARGRFLCRLLRRMKQHGRFVPLAFANHPRDACDVSLVHWVRMRRRRP